MRRITRFIVGIVVVYSLVALLYYFVFDRLEYVGLYELNIEESDFGPYQANKETYRNLQLQIDFNGNFHFNARPPYLVDSCGRWYIENRGIYSSIRLIYNLDKQGRGDQFSIVSSEKQLITDYPIPKDTFAQVPELVFVKID